MPLPILSRLRKLRRDEPAAHDETAIQVRTPIKPLLRHLRDFEKPFEAHIRRPYQPSALVAFALNAGDYWAGLALGWVEAGVKGEGLHEALKQASRDQRLSHANQRLAAACAARLAPHSNPSPPNIEG